MKDMLEIPEEYRCGSILPDGSRCHMYKLHGVQCHSDTYDPHTFGLVQDLAYKFADSDYINKKADGMKDWYPYWYAWALEEAYVAGAATERSRCAKICEDCHIKNESVSMARINILSGR